MIYYETTEYQPTPEDIDEMLREHARQDLQRLREKRLRQKQIIKRRRKR